MDDCNCKLQDLIQSNEDELILICPRCGRSYQYVIKNGINFIEQVKIKVK